ncbi:sulfotransferase 6B1-like [Esox lucius]|uniref:Sulfotransferase n=1 Tax=Esox lucius TaxID=8010 RepID=A0A3P9AFY4_ESOLU|nr:sulfotransferase 6B1-like [Esox lucius]
MNNSFLAKMQSKVEMAKGMKEDDKLYRYKGVLYPVLMSPEENLKAIETMEARVDDVVLVAYPKCGFNWMLGVLNKIIAASTGGKAEFKFPAMMEFGGPEIQEVIRQAPSPRLLGTHMHPDNIPESFSAKKTKMLVMFRNPKDTVVSFYHFTNKNPVLPTAESWDCFFSEFMSGQVPWGSYFDHALAWEKRVNDPNVMIVTFEELKQDLSEGVQRVSDFFGLSLSDAQVQAITEESTFSAMKESSKETLGQMGNVIFRKGDVGDWKNYFSPDQSQEMDTAFEKHLAGTKLGAKLKYDLYCN